MAVAVRSSNKLAYGTHANPVVPAPATIVNGDVLLLVGVVYNNSLTPTPPAGFAAPAGATGGLLATTTVFSVTMKLYAWTKTAAAESGSYTVTIASSSNAWWIGSLSGADTTTPVPSFTGNNGIGQTSTALSVTTTVDGSMVFVFGCDDGDTSNNLAIAGTTPTFANLIVTPVVLGGLNGVMSPAGTTGDKTFTNNNAGSTSNYGWGAAMLVLKAPASAAAPAPAPKPTVVNQAVGRAANW